MNKLTSSFLLLFFLSGIASAQDPDPNFDPLGKNVDLQKIIRVQLEFIEMPHPALTQLMRKPRQSANDESLRANCDDLLKKGEARVIETVSIITRPGQKGTAESIQEYIFPTEWEPAESAYSVTDKEGVTTAYEGTSAPTPTTFDTINLGTTLEVEPNLGSDHQIIDVRIAPSITYLAGKNHWGKWSREGVDVSVEMPLIYKLQFSTGTTLITGQPQMLAILSPKNDKGLTDHTRKVMVFIRADVLTVGR